MKDEIMVREFLKQRSEKAFSELYQSKTPYVYRLALRLTQDQTEAQELVQKMWIIAAEKLETFAWRSSLSTWLSAILINQYRNSLKRKENQLFSIHAETTDSTQHIQEFTGTAADLDNAIAELPPGYRQVIVLHDVEGYTHREIATMLGISEGTSKSQLFYARRSVRKYFTFDTTKLNQK